jgi:hypothetical protein
MRTPSYLAVLGAILSGTGWAAEPALPQGRDLGIPLKAVTYSNSQGTVGPENLAVDAQGRLYFTQGTHLYVHDPSR